MRVRRLFLRNWQRFAGEHDLLLEGKAYAVVARREDRPRRSNWLGKTSVLEAVRFALYGEHRHRLEDGWITNGEPDGAVWMVLGDGDHEGKFLIKRSRTRGKATVIEAGLAGNEPARGDEAQKKILQWVGLTREDFEASSYLGQRQLARMVLMRPEERTGIVAGWAQLGKLQEADAHNAEALGKLLDRAEALRAELCVLGDRVTALLDGGTDQTLEHALRNYQVLLEQERQRVVRHENALPGLQRDLELLRRAKEYEELEGEIERHVAAMPDGLDQKAVELTKGFLREARDAQSAAHRRMKQALELARGEFDGRCPVAGIACPAKDAINGDLVGNRRKLEAARGEHDAHMSRAHELEKQERAHEAAAQAVARAQGQYDTLRARRDQLRPAHERARMLGRTIDQVQGDIDVARAEAVKANAELQNRAAAAERWARAVAELHDVRQQVAGRQRLLEDLERQAAPRREAAAILGRGGAQRRAAQGVLAAIERTANEDVLAACGIELRVEARWEQEGRDPAKTCEVCGQPFPPSAKVKQCGRCLSPRGKHTINRLEFDFGRSGGAEDLAGLALQLGASRWMREHRGAAWAAALVDEPFGHLDEEHRGAVGRQLPEMLRAAGFEQAFIVAHHAAALDALPGRILVTGRGDRSEVRVIA